MKKYLAILSILLTPAILTSCLSYPTTSSVPYDISVSSPSSYSTPGAYVTPGSIIGNLNNLPDTSTSPEEQKLANLLSRKVRVEFPLKAGVLLYKEVTNLDSKTRREIYDKFLASLRANSDVSSVQEISPSLIGTSNNVEDLRKLAARFQVSTLFIINDSYQPTSENKDKLVTPIDIVNGNKNWQSYTNIEIFALDVLNGVFVASSSVNSEVSDKYNKDNPSKNKDTILTTQSANNAWSLLTSRVNQEINKFKNINNQISSPSPSSSVTTSNSSNPTSSSN